MNTQNNFIGDILIMKQLNIKPNFSALERTYGVNRHTLKKYYNNPETKRKSCQKLSKYEKYREELVEIFSNPHVTIMGAYQYLIDQYPDDNLNYNGLKHYVRLNELRTKKSQKTAHVRYETSPGKQLQVDWKEDLQMTTRFGETITFNLYSATLGFSRLHTFIYSRTKTTEDFLRCTINTLQNMGGKPSEILTDNMSAIVNVNKKRRKKHAIIKQFEKDCDLPIELCKVRTPETKGKVESSNRFLNWLYAYDNKFNDESELIEIVQRITYKVNRVANETTNIPPLKLFAKEKEYLQPLPSKVLLDNYVCDTLIKTVPSTLLVNYNGNGYSVPRKFIGKRVKLVKIEQNLYIYYNTDLIACHPISDKKFNYLLSHYTDALSSRIDKTDSMIDEMARNNLALFDDFYGDK